MSTEPLLHLTSGPSGRTELLSQVWAHRGVLRVMATTAFQSRYKQARLGIVWAIAVPILQAATMAFVFSRLIRFETGSSYAVFVIGGMVPWAYFGSSITAGSTAIVERVGLATKVWFPRALLPLIAPITGLVSFAASLLVVVAIAPALGAPLGPELLALIPATVFLVSFALVGSLMLAALDVYFRDVRHGIQAAVLLWFYLTPIIYPTEIFRGAQWMFDFNPMTGVLSLFRYALLGDEVALRPIVVSGATVLVLGAVALEVYRRHDRLFADRK